MVRREVERAVSAGKPIFPVRIEEVLPARSLEFFVSATHWIDAWQGALAEHAERLAEELLDERALRGAADAVRGKQKRRLMRRVSISTIIVALIASAALIIAVRSGRGPASGVGDDYDPVRTFARDQGIDIDRVSAKDFRVNVAERFGINMLLIEVEEGLGAFISDGMVRFRTGTGPWRPVTNSPLGTGFAAMLEEGDIATRGPFEIQIFANDGRVGSKSYGPYKIDVDVQQLIASERQSAIDKLKSEVEKSRWLMVAGGGGLLRAH